jgi:hypothetical protein
MLVPKRPVELDLLGDPPPELWSEPLTYESHNPDAPRTSANLEDFISKATLDRLARFNENIKGSGSLQRSLIIDFDELECDMEQLNVQSLDSVYASDLPFHAINAVPLEESERMFRARVEQLPPRYQDVVLKFGSSDEEKKALKRESDLYQKELSRAQNLMVPFCVGLFSGKDDNEEIYCLVLQFVGTPIPCTSSFSQLPAKER